MKRNHESIYLLFLLHGLLHQVDMDNLHLNAIKLNFVHLKFKDHYDFKEKNIDFFIKKLHKLKNCKSILFSEKDYFRLSDKLLNKLRKVVKIVIVQIEFDFIYDDKQAFNNQILKLVK